MTAIYVKWPFLLVTLKKNNHSFNRSLYEKFCNFFEFILQFYGNFNQVKLPELSESKMA